MVRIYLGALIFLGAMLPGPENVSASSLAEENARLQARRIEIEGHANDLTKELRDLQKRTHALERDWLTCANGRWQLLWQTTVKRSNDARIDLEAQRTQLLELHRQLGDRNFALDQARRRLEKQFPIKSDKYEFAFREYMHSVTGDYLDRMENEYFYGVDKYLSGIKSYQAFLTFASRACSSNDVAPQTLELGLRHVKDILDVVKSIKDILKPI